VLHHSVGVVVEFLKIMTEITHDMSALQDPFQEFVLASEIPHVGLFALTHVLAYVAADKLILETVDGPSNVSG